VTPTSLCCLHVTESVHWVLPSKRRMRVHSRVVKGEDESDGLKDVAMMNFPLGDKSIWMCSPEARTPWDSPLPSARYNFLHQLYAIWLPSADIATSTAVSLCDDLFCAMSSAVGGSAPVASQMRTAPSSEPAMMRRPLGEKARVVTFDDLLSRTAIGFPVNVFQTRMVLLPVDEAIRRACGEKASSLTSAE
jgi:hypothetical protein